MFIINLIITNINSKGVSFPPFCLRLIQQVSHLLTYNFRIPKTYFFFSKKNSLTPLKTPLSLKKLILKLLRLPCCWYSKRVSWDTGRSWKWFSLIRLLITKKTCQNIHIFDWFDNCWKLLIFYNVWDVFSLLRGRINLIPFHERPVSQDTRLEYQQQGNRSNLKIHFLDSGGSCGGSRKKMSRKKKYVLGILKL